MRVSRDLQEPQLATARAPTPAPGGEARLEPRAAASVTASPSLRDLGRLGLGAADGGHALQGPWGCWYEKKFLDSGDKVSIDLLEEESGNGWHDYGSIYVII
jgi:hypothetical protein